jgi:methyl-accepting chemotaxis protein
MEGVTITVLAAAVGQGIALAGCYYGLKADNAALGAKLDQAMLKERLDRQDENNTLRQHVQGLCSQIELTIKELSHRLGTLESGQDEWTQSLRKRTHELAEQLHVLVLKVDRLERPAGHPQS